MKKSYLLFILIISLFGTAELHSQYCTPSANCTAGDGVTYFALGPFSNTSGCESDMGVAGYGDYTALPGFELGQGVTYTAVLQSGFGGQQMSIWIDSDNSESFEATELVLADALVGLDQVNVDVTIPPDFPLGTYRLRIQAAWLSQSSLDPCTQPFYGGTEDYTVTIVPPPSCINVSQLMAGSVSAFSAEISWIDPGTSSVWDLEIVPAGMPATGTPSPGFDDIANPVSISGLEPVTAYDVRVRADCGADNVTDVSFWSTPLQFTTTCASFAPPYVQDFTNFADCWDQADNGDLSTGPMDFGFSSWFSDGFAGVGFQGAQSAVLFGSMQNDWLISPYINLTAGGPYQVEFDLALNAAFSSNPVELDEDDETHFMISTDNGATWESMISWNYQNVTVASGEHFIFDLTEYDGNEVQFAFYVTNGEIDEFLGWEASIDNFRVQELGAPLQVSLDQIIEPDCFTFGNELADVYISISGGSTPYTFMWSNGTETEDLVDAEAGTVTVTVNDALGGTFTSDPIEVPGTPMVSVTAIVTDETYDGFADGSIDITSIEGGEGPYSFFWNNGSTQEDLTGVFDALWCVIVTDINNCQTDTCFEVMAGPVGINDIIDELGVILYPNPTNDGLVNISLNLSSGDSWITEIVNSQGKLILKEMISNTGITARTIDLSSEAHGIYLLRIIREKDGSDATYRIVR